VGFSELALHEMPQRVMVRALPNNPNNGAPDPSEATRDRRTAWLEVGSGRAFLASRRQYGLTPGTIARPGADRSMRGWLATGDQAVEPPAAPVRGNSRLRLTSSRRAAFYTCLRPGIGALGHSYPRTRRGRMSEDIRHRRMTCPDDALRHPGRQDRCCAERATDTKPRKASGPAPRLEAENVGDKVSDGPSKTLIPGDSDRDPGP
jgi:hypothetical protein